MAQRKKKLTAPSHIVSGFGIVVTVGRLTGVTPNAANLLCFIVGTLAPDIDGTGVITRPGTISQKLIGRELARPLDIFGEFVAKFVNMLFGHRGFIHSPLLALTIIGLGCLCDSPSSAWFGCGFATHLLTDAITKDGIPVLSPASAKRFSIVRIHTGSIQEWILTVFVGILTCIYGWPLLPENVKDAHRLIYQTFVAAI